MSKRKPIDEAPAHIAEWTAANPFAAADEFADRVREDARADVAMGRPIEDAQLIARGLAHDEGSQKDRGSRWPSLDAWIEAKLRQKTFTTDELFDMLPQVEDEDCRDFYRDGSVIISESKRKPLGRSGFDKRVTEVRKQILTRR